MLYVPGVNEAKGTCETCEPFCRLCVKLKKKQTLVDGCREAYAAAMKKENLTAVVATHSQLASPADSEWHRQQVPVGAVGPIENRLSARSVLQLAATNSGCDWMLDGILRGRIKSDARRKGELVTACCPPRPRPRHISSMEASELRAGL